MRNTYLKNEKSAYPNKTITRNYRGARRLFQINHFWVFWKIHGIKFECTLLFCVFNQSTGGSPQRTPSAQQATDIRMISADVDHVIGLEQTARGFKYLNAL